MMPDAAYWIQALGLQPYPEGGYFRQTYKANDNLTAPGLPERFGGSRAAATAIYFLLKGHQRSYLHRLKADELWHFYAGSPLTLHLIHPDGRYERLKLGYDISRGAQFQQIVPAGRWFGATVDDPQSYTLAGCTVAPGFEIDDFEMGSRDALLRQYPQHTAMIEKLAPSD